MAMSHNAGQRPSQMDNGKCLLSIPSTSVTGLVCSGRGSNLQCYAADGLENHFSIDISPGNVFCDSLSGETLHAQPGDFDDLAGQLYSLNDDGPSSGMVDLLPENNTFFPTPETFRPSTTAAPPAKPTNQERAIGSQKGPLSPPAESQSPCSEQQTLLNHLFEIQPRLLNLALRFSQRSNTTDDVEDIYRATETMIRLMDQMDRRRPSQRTGVVGFDLSGVAVLIMSGCYFSLLQAYSHLVDILTDKADAAAASASPGVESGQNTTAVPTISVGGLRLAMPRRAAAEINLHLVVQTVQSLKGALRQCARRMGSTRRASGDSGYGNVLGIGIEDGQLGGQESMKSMLCQAVEELTEEEGKLLQHLHTVVGTSNNRIFSMG